MPPRILGFHVRSERTKIKLRLKILSFYLYRVKDIFKRNICWPVFSSVDRFALKTEHGFFTMRDIGIVSGQHVTYTKISIRLMSE